MRRISFKQIVFLVTQMGNPLRVSHEVIWDQVRTFYDIFGAREHLCLPRNQLRQPSNRKFSRDSYLTILIKLLKILSIAHWLDNKIALESLLAPEMKRHDQIRQ